MKIFEEEFCKKFMKIDAIFILIPVDFGLKYEFSL